MAEAARASLPWIRGYHMYKRTTGKRQWNTCEHGSIWCHDLCRADTRDIIDRHSLSCNELLTLFESLGKNFSVGNPLIVNPSTSFLVESILAMTTSSFSLKCSPRSSQIGASCLQWPHHGASEEGTHTMLNCSWYGTAATQDRGYSQNYTKTCLVWSRATSLKFLPTSTFTGFWSQSSGISSVFRWGCTGEYEILSVLAILHYLLTLASVLSTNNIALSHVYMCTVQNVSTKLSTNK